MGPAGRALVEEAGRPAATALAALTAVGLLVLLGQTARQAAVAPGAAGLATLALALLPGVLALVLPVALLFGLVAAAGAWREGGDWLALATAGRGARTVVPAVLLLGLGVGVAEAVLTHALEPLGRRQARRTLAQAAGELHLQPGRPAVLGGVLLHAEAVDGSDLSGVFLASGDTALASRSGRLAGGGLLLLEDGQAMHLGGAPARGALPTVEWRLDFGQAELALELASPRVELTERGAAELAQLIARQEAAGESSAVARLTLLKRSALPACLPLLALLAVPMGARGARPGLAATLTVVGWWAVLRLGDQFVHSWGPWLSAAAPALAVALAAALAWRGWRGA